MELPRVLHKRVDGDRARLELEITAGLGCFDGHFPGHPIVPGVVQLAWVMHFAAEIFGFDGALLNSLEQIKFKRPIGPDQRVTLLLECRREREVLDYELLQAQMTLASGTVKFTGTA